MRKIIVTCGFVALFVVGVSAQDRTVISPERLIFSEHARILMDGGRTPRDGVVLRVYGWPGWSHWASGRPCHAVCGPVGPWGALVLPLHPPHQGHLERGDVLFNTSDRRPALYSVNNSP